MITLDIEPVSKGRPRTRFVNGQAITYTPTKTRIAQDTIKLLLVEYKSQCEYSRDTPLKLTATFYRTKSKWLKGKQKKEKLPVRKPDLDNFDKLLLDSINGLLVEDDAQITHIDAKKRYSSNGHGYIELELSEDKDK